MHIMEGPSPDLRVEGECVIGGWVELPPQPGSTRAAGLGVQPRCSSSCSREAEPDGWARRFASNQISLYRQNVFLGEFKEQRHLPRSSDLHKFLGSKIYSSAVHNAGTHKKNKIL